jgi:hypothetical protein
VFKGTTTSKLWNGKEDGAIEGQVGEPLRVTVLFSDEASANKVKEIQSGVIEKLQPGYSIRNTWWGLESLKNKELFENLCLEAAQTDLLFVAVSAAVELPRETTIWLNAVPWKNSGRGLAFVAVFGTVDEPATDYLFLDDYLRDLADRAGGDYFAFHYRLPTPVEIYFSNGLQHERKTITPIWPKFSERVENTSHWGINE